LYANKAVAGDSLLSDAKLALESLIELVPKVQGRTVPPAPKPETKPPSASSGPLHAIEAFAALSELRPKNAIIVDECASSAEDVVRTWPTSDPESYYSFASGGLGWGAPAAVGIAIAQKKTGNGRPVVAFMGDGAMQYSVQCLYSAAQHKANVIFIVACNAEYAILREFGVLQETPNVPGLDLPGFDFVSTARGYGVPAVEAKTKEEIKEAFGKALKTDGPSLISIPVAREPNRPLVTP
jgi:benzoylformate decarboxylase